MATSFYFLPLIRYLIPPLLLRWHRCRLMWADACQGGKASLFVANRQYLTGSISGRRGRPVALSPLVLAALLLVGFLAACSSQPMLQTGSAGPSSQSAVGSAKVLAAIRAQYANWRQVPYRWGGNDQRGIDCSALVQRTFREQFKLSLPRATREQGRHGYRIARSALRAGDLVFFKTGARQRHVGIYLENQQFLHVSTSRGVTISSLTNRYWNKRFTQARRVL